MKCKNIIKQHIDHWGLENRDSIQKIVIEYLEDNDFHGLFNSEADNCGCGLDDLFPCDEDFSECRTALKRGEFYYPAKKGKK